MPTLKKPPVSMPDQVLCKQATVERMKTMQAKWFAQRDEVLRREEETVKTAQTPSAAERPRHTHQDSGLTRGGCLLEQAQQLVEQAVREELRLGDAEAEYAPAQRAQGQPGRPPGCPGQPGRQPGGGEARQGARRGGSRAEEQRDKACAERARRHSCHDLSRGSAAEEETRRMLQEIAAEEEALGVWCLQDTLLSMPASRHVVPAFVQRPDGLNEDDEDFAELDEMNDFLTAVQFQMHELEHMDGTQ